MLVDALKSIRRPSVCNSSIYTFFALAVRPDGSLRGGGSSAVWLYGTPHQMQCAHHSSTSYVTHRYIYIYIYFSCTLLCVYALGGFSYRVMMTLAFVVRLKDESQIHFASSTMKMEIALGMVNVWTHIAMHPPGTDGDAMHCGASSYSRIFTFRIFHRCCCCCRRCVVHLQYIAAVHRCLKCVNARWLGASVRNMMCAPKTEKGSVIQTSYSSHGWCGVLYAGENYMWRAHTHTHSGGTQMMESLELNFLQYYTHYLKCALVYVFVWSGNVHRACRSIFRVIQNTGRGSGGDMGVKEVQTQFRLSAFGACGLAIAMRTLPPHWGDGCSVRTLN